MKRMQIYHTIIVAVALVLMGLPFGVKCYYASAAAPGSIDFNAVQMMSFFDGRLLEFNNVIPLIFGISVVGMTILSVIRSVLDSKGLHIACLGMSGLGLTLSVAPLILYGIEYYSTILMTISFLMLCNLIIDICCLRRVNLIEE